MPKWWDRVRGKTRVEVEPDRSVNPMSKMSDMVGKLNQSSSYRQFKNSDAFQKVYDSAALLNGMKSWPVTDVNRVLMEQTQRSLKEACEAYLESRQNAFTDRGKERYALVDEIYKLQQMEEKVVGNDALFNNAIANGRTWGEVLSGCRTIEATTTGPVQAIGGAMSARVPVTVGERKGFFTARNETNDLLVNAQLDASGSGTKSRFDILLAEIDDPAVKAVFSSEITKNKIVNRIDYGSLGVGYKDASEETRAQYFGEISNIISEVHPTFDAETKKRVMETIEQMCITCSGAVSMSETMVQAKIGKKAAEAADLYKRNIAASRFAAFVGQGDLIARSDKMKLNGEVEGGFMEFAKGEDIRKFGEEGGAKLLWVEEFTHPQFLRQISSLEVIDWVTGQIDRHSGNMFYQVDPSEKGSPLVGVQGIDNDMAFGTLDANSCISNQNPLEKMMVVDESLKNNLEALDKPMLEWLLGDLLNEAEIDALNKRIVAMNEQLNKDDVNKIKSDQWEIEAGAAAAIMGDHSRYYKTAKGAVMEKQAEYKERVRTPITENELSDKAPKEPKQKATPSKETSKTLQPKVKDL